MQPVVLEEDEWLGAMRAVIRRDYFPSPAGGDPPSALPNLDRFLQTHNSEDNNEFQARWREERRELAQRQTPAAKSLLLENSPSRMMVCAAATAGEGREINPLACQVLYPQTNASTAPAPVVAVEKKDKRKTVLSQPALVLAQRLRSNNKRRRV
ncbi:hypothetical protein BASA81_006620 [Batrachochytrium salamandrivorans]|nr:hypothetical protein BASA81_006620 [Batrachochytrium salamandrivorans]